MKYLGSTWKFPSPIYNVVYFIFGYLLKLSTGYNYVNSMALKKDINFKFARIPIPNLKISSSIRKITFELDTAYLTYMTSMTLEIRLYQRPPVHHSLKFHQNWTKNFGSIICTRIILFFNLLTPGDYED